MPARRSSEISLFSPAVQLSTCRFQRGSSLSAYMVSSGSVSGFSVLSKISIVASPGFSARDTAVPPSYSVPEISLISPVQQSAS